MDGGMLYSIGELARRTGLTVKAIRFYSDRGIVPPTDRSPAGYRLYSIDAVARLDLVRTLRELGVDLPTICKVVNREIPLSEVAAAHAEALAVQIRVLRLQHAVLTAVAKRGPTPKEMNLMHKLAKLSEDERRRLVNGFLDAALGGLNNHDAAAIRRSMMPELPDNPTAEQVEAWIELAELSQDPDFRASMRCLAEQHAVERGEVVDITGLRRDLASVVRDQVTPALLAGIDPASPEANPAVADVAAYYARVFDRPDDVDSRDQLLTWLETANDPRRERYFQLLSMINGWSQPETLTPVLSWITHALRAQTAT